MDPCLAGKSMYMKEVVIAILMFMLASYQMHQIGLGKYVKDSAVFLARSREVEGGRRLEALPIPLFSKGDVEMIQAAFQVRH